MTVEIRPYRKTEYWEVDIRLTRANGTKFRQRVRSPVSGKSASQRWGENRERELLLNLDKPKPEPKKEVPTLAEFANRFVENYAVANNQKAATLFEKRAILKNHLLPLIGNKRLSDIETEDVQELKANWAKGATGRATNNAKTMNNRLSVLSKLLTCAEEWGVITARKCKIRLIKAGHKSMPFLDFHEYEALVTGAKKAGLSVLLVVLLGGEAGLRRGEIEALKWTDIDFERNQITVARSFFRNTEGTTKGNRPRVVPMTHRLSQTLREHRHLIGERVLYAQDRKLRATPKVQQRWMMKAQRFANQEQTGRIHILRHTFCSHLAMKGASPRAIQELAGHSDITTTQKYMHLTPQAKDQAIALLNEPWRNLGEDLKTIAN